MSSWTAPITWTNGAVSAGTANTEWRDHLLYLKGAFDLLTNSSTKDVYDATVNGMMLQIRRGAATYPVFEGQIGAEANPRIRIYADGKIQWGGGGASAPDTTLERVSASLMALTGNTALRIENVTNAVILDLRVNGDSYARVGSVIRSDGGGELRLGDGSATASYALRFYYDPTNAQVVLGQVNSSYTSVGKVIMPVGGTASFVLSTSNATTGDYWSVYGNGDVRWLAGSTVSASLGISGNYLAVGSSSPFWCAQGVRTFTRSGTIADGNFSAAPSDGHTGVDTLHGVWYVRTGGVWKYADLHGAMSYYGPFVWSNVAATETRDGGYGVFGDLDNWVRGGTVTLDGTNPTPVTLDGTIANAVVSLNASAAPGVDPNWLSCTWSGSTLNIHAWKVTSSANPTLIASTNATAVVSYVALLNAVGVPRISTAYAGSIVGIAVRGSSNCTSGTATFKPNIAGSTVNLPAILNTTTLANDTNTADPDTYTFTVGQQLGMSMTTNAFAPTGIRADGALYVLFSRV